MCHYDGLKWPSLKEACADLGLDYSDVLTFLSAGDRSLVDYIKQHRFVVRGLIFTSLSGAALYLGVPDSELKKYMAYGYKMDLAAHMIRRGLPVNYFSLEYQNAKNTSKRASKHQKNRG